MKYKDPLQAKIDMRALKTASYGFNQDQLIGLLMLEEHLFYDQAKARWNQAIKGIKTSRQRRGGIRLSKE